MKKVDSTWLKEVLNFFMPWIVCVGRRRVFCPNAWHPCGGQKAIGSLWVSFSAVYTKLAGLQASEDSFVFPSHLLIQALRLQISNWHPDLHTVTRDSNSGPHSYTVTTFTQWVTSPSLLWVSFFKIWNWKVEEGINKQGKRKTTRESNITILTNVHHCEPGKQTSVYLLYSSF